MQKRIYILLVAVLLPHGLFAQDILAEPFSGTGALSQWQLQGVKAAVEEGVLVIRAAWPGTSMIRRDLPIRELAGKTVEFSVELSGTDVARAGSEWNGAKFLLHAMAADGREIWRAVPLPTGTFDWTRISFTAKLPENLEKASLFLGFQDSQGILRYRNLIVKPEHAFPDLKSLFNRTYADEKAGDGKGGWSDQGPDNDARNFDFNRKLFAGVPFLPAAPTADRPESVLVMNSKMAGNCPKKAGLDLPPSSARYLYLLHTLCYPSQEDVGTIRVSGIGGREEFRIRNGTDVANWWNPCNQPNAAVGATWKNAAGGVAGFYVSRFEIPERVGPVTRIEFESAGNGNLWIIAGATLTDRLYRTEPVRPVTVVPDNVWKELPRPEKPGILPGSALDRSRFSFPDNRSRLIVSPEGFLCRADAPEKKVRLLSGVEVWDSFKGRGGVTPPILGTHAQIDEYVQLLKRYGYGMTRLHYLDGILSAGTSAPLVFNPEQLDRFDYLVAALRKNGMYLNWDAMSSSQGYTPLNPWGGKEEGRRYMAFELYFDSEIRDNWIQGVTKVLTHVNPYTGTRLVDEPMLAMITGFNEQEFAFTVLNKYHRWNELIQPAWQAHLRSVYPGFADLKQAWGKRAESFRSFEDIPAFSMEDRAEGNRYGSDVARFIGQTQKGLFEFYREELRKLGCRALLANYDMGNERYYAHVRSGGDMVFMHSYHDHPSSYDQPGSTTRQNSSIGTAARSFRDLNGAKLDRMPLVVTEYGCAFWNRYRYEQSFVYGAYAALQDFSGLTFFGPAVTVVKTERINPFQAMHDPIAQGSEFLTAFLFLRGDVSTPGKRIRIHLDAEAMYRSGEALRSLSSRQSRLSLIAPVSVAVNGKALPGSNELDLKSSDGELVLVQPGYSRTVEAAGKPVDSNLLLAPLRDREVIASENRTDLTKEIFESATGELFMDCARNFMSVDTPRFQGICAEADGTAVLKDFTVNRMTHRGNLSLVSLEDNRGIAESGHLALVYLTDALNPNMVFDNPERTVLRKIGGNGPTLLATGTVEGSFRSSRAERMKLYALGLDGARRTKLPLTVHDGRVHFRIDTASISGGPAIYFEFAED